MAVVPAGGAEECSPVTAEAQAAGIAEVASGPGGPSEIMRDGETGIIVQPRDADALAEALIALANDRPRLRAMGIAGSRHVRAKFSREAYAQRVLAGIMLVEAGTGAEAIQGT